MASCHQKRRPEVNANLHAQASQNHTPVAPQLSEQAVARDAVCHLGELLDGKNRRRGHEEDKPDVERQVNQEKLKPHAVGDDALARVVIGHRPRARVVCPTSFGESLARGNRLAVLGHEVLHGLLL